MYCWLTTSLGGMMSRTSIKFTPLWNVLLTARIFVISLLPSWGSGTTLSIVPSGSSCSKKPHEQPVNSISLHVLGLTLQMMMIRGDPGNCQVTLDHLTLATVLPALCHGLMYVSVSLPCLFPLCICASSIFIWFFPWGVVKYVVENDALHWMRTVKIFVKQHSFIRIREKQKVGVNLDI